MIDQNASTPAANSQPVKETEENGGAVSRKTLAMLTHPALIFIGDQIFPASFSAWLQHLMFVAADQLTDILGTHTRIRLLRDSDRFDHTKSDMHAAVLQFNIQHDAFEAPLRFTCSEHLVDMLAHCLTVCVANLPGTGDVNDLERGLAEYAVRMCLHRMSDVVRPSDGFYQVNLTGSEFQKPGQKNDARIDLVVIAGTRRGILTIQIPPWCRTSNPQTFDNPAEMANRFDFVKLSEDLRVKLALPPIPLSSREFDAIEQGDLILLGCTSLEHDSYPCTLVTNKGWQIATCQIVIDTPVSVATKIKSIDICSVPTALIPGSDSRPSLLPTVGNLRMPLTELATCKPGNIIEFTKDTDCPIDLHLGPEYVGRGELVRVGDELAIRLIRFDGLRIPAHGNSKLIAEMETEGNE